MLIFLSSLNPLTIEIRNWIQLFWCSTHTVVKLQWGSLWWQAPSHSTNYIAQWEFESNSKSSPLTTTLFCFPGFLYKCDTFSPGNRSLMHTPQRHRLSLHYSSHCDNRGIRQPLSQRNSLFKRCGRSVSLLHISERLKQRKGSSKPAKFLSFLAPDWVPLNPFIRIKSSSYVQFPKSSNLIHPLPFQSHNLFFKKNSKLSQVKLWELSFVTGTSSTPDLHKKRKKRTTKKYETPRLSPPQ